MLPAAAPERLTARRAERLTVAGACDHMQWIHVLQTLPAETDCLTGPQGVQKMEELPALPAPALERLTARGAERPAAAGAAAVGDALSGTALAAVDAAGTPRCLWPARHLAPDAVAPCLGLLGYRSSGNALAAPVPLAPL